MKQRHVFQWLTFDMVLFAGLNLYLLVHFSDRFGMLASMSSFELLVLGLAAYRAANIISNEAVTKPLRMPFVDEKVDDGKVVEMPKKEGFMGAMGLLIYCPSCTGVWIAASLVYLYVLFPNQTFVVSLFLAMSAIERVLAAVVGKLKEHS